MDEEHTIADTNPGESRKKLKVDLSELVFEMDKLEIALDGKGAFRRFRNVLNQHPDELDRWCKFKDDWMRDEAVQWLFDYGIEPAQVDSGYFNDDGTEFNPDLVPKPGLCLMCRKDNAGGKKKPCAF